MPTASPTSTTTITRILGTLLATASTAACDEQPQQGIIVDEARLIELTDDLAIYFVELEGETRRVEVSVASDGDAFRILDGDRLALEVRDGQDGPKFRAPDQRAWSIDAECDALTDSVAEFVLDGGLVALDDEDEFRAAAPTGPCFGCYY